MVGVASVAREGLQSVDGPFAHFDLHGDGRGRFLHNDSGPGLLDNLATMGAGSFQIGNPATLEFGAAAAAGTLAFEAGAGQLAVDDPAKLHAQVTAIARHAADFHKSRADTIHGKALPFAASHALLAEATGVREGEAFAFGGHAHLIDGVHKGDLHNDLFQS